ncbi:predicted protein [Pyrenophora tritici-repentis Pt-1C-BFP]|uniref:Uncharacterized protein n=1 Tax=Pyrenophora tritici-repentis (strain Pt-1C-BFP) TaxID=426418 RepID=B2VZM9_PYRTR|nr:uncharacterized protein PTRG_02869 [Pyrenophora tritici-repentis Pt-1C-BFP]EDU45392.1 predicted protein [Pyrenophora tritici-repentis Pt-1C-BFP]
MFDVVLSSAYTFLIRQTWRNYRSSLMNAGIAQLRGYKGTHVYNDRWAITKAVVSTVHGLGAQGGTLSREFIWLDDRTASTMKVFQMLIGALY